MYEDLVYATPGLTGLADRQLLQGRELRRAAGDVAAPTRRSAPADRTPVGRVRRRDDQRDEFGVPHIYGRRPRRGDVRRRLRRGRGPPVLHGRAAPRRPRRALLVRRRLQRRDGPRASGADTPYNEAELQLQYDLGDDVYGADGVQLQEDVDNYVDGINQYIAEAAADPGAKMPGEYAALGHPDSGPDPWKVTDVIATASLVAGIFGKGGGGEVGSALVLEEAKQRFGASRASGSGPTSARRTTPRRRHDRPRRRPSRTGPARARRARRGGWRCPTRAPLQSEPVVALRRAARGRRPARAPAGLLGALSGRTDRPRTPCSSRRRVGRAAIRSR